MEFKYTFADKYLFQYITQSLGGRLEREAITPYFMNEVYGRPLERFVEILNKAVEAIPELEPLIGNLLVDYIFSLDINAAHGTDGKHSYIGVNSGLVDSISQVVMSLFAHPDIFPMFGEPEIERLYGNHQKWDSFYKLGFGADKRIMSMEGTKYNLIGWPLPRNTERLDIAYLATELAIEFSFLHEFAHLICNHPKLLRHLKDVYKSSTITLHVRDYADLEFDADLMAIQLHWKLRLKDLEGLQRSPVTNTRWLNRYQHPQDIVFTAWCIGFISLQLLIAQNNPLTSLTVISNPHPHPLIRLGYITRYLGSAVVDGIQGSEQFYGGWAHMLNLLPSYWKQLDVPGWENLPPSFWWWDRLLGEMNELYFQPIPGKVTLYQLSHRLGFKDLSNCVLLWLNTQ